VSHAYSMRGHDPQCERMNACQRLCAVRCLVAYLSPSKLYRSLHRAGGGRGVEVQRGHDHRHDAVLHRQRRARQGAPHLALGQVKMPHMIMCALYKTLYGGLRLLRSNKSTCKTDCIHMRRWTPSIAPGAASLPLSSALRMSSTSTSSKAASSSGSWRSCRTARATASCRSSRTSAASQGGKPRVDRLSD